MSAGPIQLIHDTALPLRSDALLMRLFDVSPDPIAVTEYESSRLLMCNNEFCRMTGYKLEELKGRRAVDLGLWESVEERQRYTKLAVQSGGLQGHPTTFRSKDGRRMPVLISATVIEQDGVRYLLAVIHDTTERERRRMQHEAVLSNAMVGIACTHDRIFQLTNARYEQMFGWPTGSLIGMPGSVVWPSAQAYQEIGEFAGPLLMRGEPIDVERELCRRDGSRFWARLRARAVDPEQPLTSSTVWIIEDVTERRRNEQALARAKEQAEAASLAKSQFLANTSHEIRTPLNGLLGLVRLALSEQGPPATVEQLKQYLGRIQDSAQTLAHMLSEILDFSKIEAGQLSLELLVFDLPALLASASAPYAELARAQGLGFRLHVASDLPQWVRGDPMRIRQVLGNYLSNAMKFSERGVIEVDARCALGQHIRITVTDQGLGADAETLSRLFEPFSQADASTTRRFGGTGLGLSICKQLARLMGGDVGVKSSPGEGSEFWMEIPLPTMCAEPAGSVSQERPEDVLAGCRILLVEDNPVNTLVAEATLRLWGVEVSVATNGAEALDAVQGETPLFDLVLMDLQMPVMGGLDATRALRLRYGADDLPVIALTAGVMVSEREAALAAGMNDFLAKPIDPDRLAQVISHWLAHGRSARRLKNTS